MQEGGSNVLDGGEENHRFLVVVVVETRHTESLHNNLALHRAQGRIGSELDPLRHTLNTTSGVKTRISVELSLPHCSLLFSISQYPFSRWPETGGNIHHQGKRPKWVGKQAGKEKQREDEQNGQQNR